MFDTMLAVDGELCLPDLHFERLVRHAALLKIDFSLDFTATASALLQRNGFTTGRYAIRTTVTRGPAARGLRISEQSWPTLIMRADSVTMSNEAVTVIIASTVRRNEHSPLSNIKSLNYGDQLLASMEARERHADDAILLNGSGHACCATTSNLFIVEKGRYFTPPLQDGVLDGITRRSFIENHEVCEQSIALERLLAAEAVFLTNSIFGVRLVREIVQDQRTR
ncbi:aminotransferase class IV [Kineobactrum salinum]|uniref:branched-chain-amino-acid transaminase n=1 Tax=Kineobactrum salinum TaxID=2708301 RepID=A0A6C0U9U6_9GAMM|nr:aminotransferase class IV [Kineobactrum salinum]QIB66484.1 aminotransferase class IV [Kineobactrum salinum]